MQIIIRAVLTATIAFLFVASGSWAMDSDSTCKKMITRDYGYISPGVWWTDLHNVNKRLGIQGLSTFDGMVPSFNLGGHREVGRMIMESNWSWNYWWRDNLDNEIRTTYRATNLLWTSGINVLPDAVPVTMFPLIGLGVGMNFMRIRSDERTLAGILVTSEPNTMMYETEFLLTAGLGSDLILADKEKSRGLIIGIRAGFLFCPTGKNRWYSDGIRINDLKSVRQNGAYLRLILGAYGKKHDHDKKCM
jgi:hypothetical protein